MPIKEFNIDDYCNDVADAIKRLGGVDIAAEKLDTFGIEVRMWIKSGYVPESIAEKIHYKTGTPIYDLVQRRVGW